MTPAGLFSGTAIPVLEQVVQFSQSRHAVLAGNLANIDTPGYQTRDLSVEKFQHRLKQAIDSRDGRARCPSAPSFAAEAGPAVMNDASLHEVNENLDGILLHDQSNVSVEQQVVEINKNQSQHNLAIAILTSQFQLLQAAISERA